MVVKKSYLKIIWREFKSSFGRFAAIFGIVALGVGFLSGLLVTTPDMHMSVDEYYDKHNMADIFIKATMGLTKEDVESIDEVSNVKDTMPAYVIDKLLQVDGKGTIVGKIYGIPLLDYDAQNSINKLDLYEGRMPKNSRECVVERKGTHLEDVKIGTRLRISKENKEYEDIDDLYKEKEFEVVGIVGNSFHFSKEREPSNVGSGKLGTIIYVDYSAYALDEYTDLYIVADRALKMSSFSTRYVDYIEEIRDEIEDLGEERSLVRKEEILKTANEELDDGYKDYYDGKKEAEEQLADARSEINKGKKDLKDALVEIKEGEEELVDARKTLEKENKKALKEIEKNEKILEEAKLSLIKGQDELKASSTLLEEGQIKYNEGLKESLKGKKDLEEAEKEFKRGQEEFKKGEREFLKGKEDLNKGKRESAKALISLQEGEEKYNKGIIELKAGKDLLLDSIIPIAEITGLTKEELISTQEGRQILKSFLPLENYEMLINNYEKIIYSEEELRKARLELDYGWMEYYKGIEKLKTAEKELNQAGKEIEKGRKELESNELKLNMAKKELEEGFKDLERAKEDLEEGKEEYKKGLLEIDKGWDEYESGKKDLLEGKKTLEKETENAIKKIEDGEKDLVKGRKEYEKGIRDIEKAEDKYKEAKEQVEEELNDAYLDLKKAEQEIRYLDDPKWYVLDRDANMSYISFDLNADKVAAISKVFPIFFYLVAGLVALTTMTRMVEEERSQIGVLKALGYKKWIIISKYLLYCGMASILGSIAGQVVGFKVIPVVLWNAYGVMYHLPEFVADYNIKIALLSSGMAVISTLGATYFSANSALKEKPSTLMLPRAPKVGKRILLERIKPLWSLFSFNLKSTARNIFRYKKHFYMTVIGVSGCTALLVAGFGLRDSIKNIGTLQFEELFKHDLEIVLEEDFPLEDIDTITSPHQEIIETLQVFTDRGFIEHNGRSIETTLVAVEDISDLSTYVVFRDRVKASLIETKKESIVISEKVAEVLNIKENDTILYENFDEKKGQFKVSEITENYLDNFIYMNKSMYEDVFKTKEENRTIYIKTRDLNESEKSDLIKKLYGKEGVLNAEFISERRGLFDNLITSINYIVGVIIISSGMLAFIVLYNLTNININERRRELATLKVLGFHNEEVSSYIFREITILSVVGTLVGLVLGKYLHQFIVLTVENPNFMFGRDISLLSYILSGVITLIFSVVVDLFMIKKLRNIKMVDSLKAND